MTQASPFTKVESLVQPNSPEILKDFMKLMTEDCKNDPDCDEILSPCCKSVLETVFGSLPLQVVCRACSKSYLLRDLV
jgi:hypothetical protein